MDEKWTTIIKPKDKWYMFNFGELIQYKDLIFLFVKRDFSVRYKQTILGPLWFIINPLLTTFTYTVIFGTVAGLSTDGVPQFAFYLCGISLWQYFAACLNQTANTFIGNAGIFGKVYFPRLTIPVATVIFSAINFSVVFVMSILTNLFYSWQGTDVSCSTNYLVFIPLFIFQTAALGLGMGIIISSVTTKYKDLQVLVSFGIQLWMYITPVVYTTTQIPETVRPFLMMNPMSPIINNFRYVMLGCGEMEWLYWGISMVTTVVVLFLGLVLFNKIEKTFMDTI